MRDITGRKDITCIEWLYHFTDTRNIPLIQELGGLYSRAKLKAMRIERIFCGGNQWSLDADEMCGMDHYVHLCFLDRHPMEYIAKTDGRLETSMFFRIDAKIIQNEGVRYSPGVSNKSGMKAFTIEEAQEMIDYEVLYARMNWNDPQIQARRQAAERAEILVPDHVPMKYLRW